MFEPHTRNHCECCLNPPFQEDNVVAHLLSRISALEEENRNLERLEETIRDNTYLFEAFLSRTHDGIVLLTPEMTILRLIHPAFAHSEGELIGQSALRYLHPDDREPFTRAFIRLLGGPEKNHSLRCRARHKNGEWVLADFDMTDMLDDPKLQAILVSYRAIGSPA
jgi:PAS domain-containing protein